VLAVSLICAAAASAHEVRPVYLELRERDATTLDARLKVPARGDQRLGVALRLPPGAVEQGQPRGGFAGEAYLERRTFVRAGGWDGVELQLDGLAGTRTDALVRVEWRDGSVQNARVLPGEPRFTLRAAPGRGEVATSYLGLGVEHIVLGVDHLLFVLALFLLVPGERRLVATITAFTVAHSITLAAATLGFVHVPGPPVEACIALSVAFVAAEIVHGRRGLPGLTARRPWLVAGSFGLLHGLGFAGALSEVGLPELAIPIALLFFNLGVEVGQLAFLAVAAGLLAALRAARPAPPAGAPAWRGILPAYAIGACAAFWVIQRVASLGGP
jgi:hydrogenase/urease accessory protein HupE